MLRKLRRMESFDRSLRHLLSTAPAEVLGFGQGQTVLIYRTVETTLRARRRDVDGCYLVGLSGRRVILHVEFHRRHQSLEDLASDVAEAQLRLYRREKLPVLSQVWDLYGRDDEPVLSERELLLGPLEPCS